MIRITVKGLAKFMAGTSSQQRKVLRDFKNPDPEGWAQANYYHEAQDLIASYHREGRNREWLTRQASAVSSLANAASGRSRTRLEHNARVLLQYEQHFGARRFQVLPGMRLSYVSSEVKVTCSPDLHVREGNTAKIIKLEFTRDAPAQQVLQVICQVIFEAQMAAGAGLQSSSVLLFDVPRGREHRGARMGSRVSRDVEAACQNISAMWDGI